MEMVMKTVFTHLENREANTITNIYFIFLRLMICCNSILLYLTSIRSIFLLVGRISIKIVTTLSLVKQEETMTRRAEVIWLSGSSTTRVPSSSPCIFCNTKKSKIVVNSFKFIIRTHTKLMIVQSRDWEKVGFDGLDN